MNNTSNLEVKVSLTDKDENMKTMPKLDSDILGKKAIVERNTKIEDEKTERREENDKNNVNDYEKSDIIDLKVLDDTSLEIVKPQKEKESNFEKNNKKYFQSVWAYNMRDQQQQSYGNQPQGGYGPPQGGYGPQQGGYGPPQGGYGPPQGGYGSPQGGYGPPQGGYGPPPGGYGPPPGGYGPPPGGYGPPPGGYGPPQGGYYGPPQDRDEYGGGGGTDYDPETRNPFIRMVFTILFFMLVATAAFILAVLIVDELHMFYRSKGLVYYIGSGILVIGMSFIMACSPCVRVPPFNIICLFLAVVVMSNFAACVTAKHKTDILFYAFLATTATVVVCMILAYTSFDFTKWILYVIAISVVFAIVALSISIAMLVMKVHYKPLHLVLIFISTILNVVFLIMELQMILGGRSVELGEEDYAIGAFMLYTTIVQMFLDFVRMFGLLDNW